MNTIFDNLTGNVDLSIFGKSNTDPKTPLRRRYLSLVGLLEYVDILNGDLTGRELPDGITEETVKGMIIHGIGDLDTMKVMSAEPEPEPEPETDYVDLGLPSGTLWAKHNIQDKAGNELYFAWGETSGFTAGQVGVDKNFTWDDYGFGEKSELTKYNETDGKTELESGDDAAMVNWGEGWKMPTRDQFEELMDNTTYEWTTIDGVLGAKFTSKVKDYTDKFLFFPAVGYAEEGKVYNVGDYGGYWSVSLYDLGVNDAWSFYFEDGDCGMYGDGRYCGCSVRPVRFQNP